MKKTVWNFSCLSVAFLFAGHRAIPGALTAACLCFLSALLVACGGSSSSGAVSAGQEVTQNNDNVMQTPPSPSEPDAPAPETGNNATYSLGNTPQTVIDQCMSEADKEMLTQVNDARTQTRDCGGVTYPATAPLSWQCTLEDVAYGHSRDMGDHNFFSHTGSDGLGSADRMTNAGYGWFSVGENIAAGQQTIGDVMAAWLASPGHCENIMHSSYTELGAAGYVVNGSDFPIYWTQVFARPRV